MDNSGGNLVDFLLQHQGDVALVEIKTPTARLLGAEYRHGVYPPSRELSGAVAQALSYRLSLLNDLHSLRVNTPGLAVHSPSICVILGDAEQEELSGPRRRSFELFRTALKDVHVLTYDELFGRIADLAVWADPAS